MANSELPTPLLRKELAETISPEDQKKAMQEGAAWSRDDLVENAIAYLGSGHIV